MTTLYGTFPAVQCVNDAMYNNMFAASQHQYLTARLTDITLENEQLRKEIHILRAKNHAYAATHADMLGRLKEALAEAKPAAVIIEEPVVPEPVAATPEPVVVEPVVAAVVVSPTVAPSPIANIWKEVVNVKTTKKEKKQHYVRKYHHATCELGEDCNVYPCGLYHPGGRTLCIFHATPLGCTNTRVSHTDAYRHPPGKIINNASQTPCTREGCEGGKRCLYLH
jgi:hypothetical protein